MLSRSHRIPLFVVAVGQVSVEDGPATTYVAPVQPNLGRQKFVDESLERGFEDAGSIRQTVSMCQAHRVGHVRDLEAITPEVELAVCLGLHRRPVVRQLPGEVVDMADMTELFSGQRGGHLVLGISTGVDC